MQHETSAAIQFMHLWAPEGPWVLTRIVPDGGRISTRTFYPDQEDAAYEWVEEAQGRENIYFAVNPVRHKLKSKAKKTAVAALAWLHVDIDPRAGEDIESERVRALRVLSEFEPKPTVIVDSGGGYQGFWKLEEEQPTNGDEGRSSELEAYNQQLELLLGGDHCHNIDRIMRLPGTINVPDARKRKKGRQPALASLVEAHWEREYPLSAFTPAPRVQASEGGSGGGERVRISGNLPRLGSVDDLPESVTAYTKMLIVQGDDPDDPTKYPSRSEVLFRVCVDLVRADCDDDTIASVLLDPDFAISSSVLDKPRPERYAARQIQRAREEADDPWLRKLNEKHAVIEDIGGKCRIISEVFDYAMQRFKLSRQSFEDFRNRYRNVRVIVGTNKDGQPIEAPVGKWWLDHPQRRQFETLVFAPGHEVPNAYNLWTGFACEALPGDCDLFLKHIFENICSRNEEHFNYVIGWMATAVQHPDRPGEVALVLRGKRGTGKGVFVKTFGNLWGRHFLQVADPKHLVGSFNAHLRDCVVLFADEAFYAGDKKHESVLKMLITEEIIPIEAKGVDTEVAPNYTHILLASNEQWVVPAGLDERRFMVLDVADSQAQNSAYFAAIKRQLKNGGQEALLHYLLNYDLSDFDLRKPPQTAALQDQKMLSFAPEEQWLFEKLVEGRMLPEHTGWRKVVPKRELQEDYIRFMKDLGINRRFSPTAIGKFLKRASPGIYPRTFQQWAEVRVFDSSGGERIERQRPYFYEFPELEELRAHWDAEFGGPYPWEPVTDGYAEEPPPDPF